MRPAWLFAVLGLASAGLSACSAQTGPQRGVALDGTVTAASLAAATVAAPGPALVVFFLQWPEDASPGGFPRASLDAIAAAGATPVLTWEPMYYRRADGAETMIPAGRITGGDYDAYLRSFAREARAWGRPLLIRFAHEMNLSRYHWGGPAAEFGPASPERYRAMWRYVVGIFRSEGATNVRWAFSPNCESVPGAGSPAAAWNTARAYYPGDDVVDVLGMDGYNWGDTQVPERHGWRSTWRSFEQIFGPLRAELLALAPGKPLYVFETATAATGGDKAAWIAGLAATARAWRLDGVVWFEADKEVDWRLATGVPPAALEPLRGLAGAAR